MTVTESSLQARLHELRRAFDDSFAGRPTINPPFENLLLLSIGSGSYAVRIGECAGLHALHRVTPVPSPIPALMGLSTFRSVIVAVHDLAMLLGHARAEAPRWLLVAARAPVAFAFASFDGHLKTAPERVGVAEAAHDRRFIREVTRVGEELVSIIDLESVVAAIQQRARADKENS